MGKRVLASVDLHSVSEAAILYGIELAARIQSSMALIVVSSLESTRESVGSGASRRSLGRGRHKWMDRAVAESQEKGVNLEIFVASGRFFEEVTRFVRSQPALRFIVMAAPKDKDGKNATRVASELRRLHQEFEGEILLVEKAGRITRFSDLHLPSSARESSI